MAIRDLAGQFLDAILHDHLYYWASIPVANFAGAFSCEAQLARVARPREILVGSVDAEVLHAGMFVERTAVLDSLIPQIFLPRPAPAQPLSRRGRAK